MPQGVTTQVLDEDEQAVLAHLHILKQHGFGKLEIMLERGLVVTIHHGGTFKRPNLMPQVSKPKTT